MTTNAAGFAAPVNVYNHDTMHDERAIALACAEQTKARLDIELAQLCAIDNNLKVLVATINAVVPGLLSENGDLKKDRSTLSNLWTWIKLVVTGDIKKIEAAFEKFYETTNPEGEEVNIAEGEISKKPAGLLKEFLAIKIKIEDYTQAVFARIDTYTSFAGEIDSFEYEAIPEMVGFEEELIEAETTLEQTILSTTKAALPGICAVAGAVGAAYFFGDTTGLAVAAGTIGGALAGGVSYLTGKFFETLLPVEEEEQAVVDDAKAVTIVEGQQVIQEAKVEQTPMTAEESKKMVNDYFTRVDPEFAEFISTTFTFPERMKVELSKDQKTITISELPVVNPKLNVEVGLTPQEFDVLDRRNIEDLQTLKSVKKNTKAMPDKMTVGELSYFGSIGEKAMTSLKKGETPMSLGPTITFTKKDKGIVAITGGPKGIDSIQFIKSTPGNGAIKINPEAWINDTYYIKDLKRLISLLK